MAYETPTIVASRRERTGSRYAQRLRKDGRLPAVIYGHKTDPVAVSIDQKEILTYVQHGTHVMKVDIEGGPTETCLVKDLQYGYLGDNVVHVDFARVNLKEEVTVRVHLDFVGTPEEVHHAGAILNHNHTELTVTCKVSDIPESIRVDQTKMEGMQLTAGEIELPPGLKLGEDEHTIIVSITFVKRLDEPGEEAELETAEGEPEVITEAKADEGEGKTKDVSEES